MALRGVQDGSAQPVDNSNGGGPKIPLSNTTENCSVFDGIKKMDQWMTQVTQGVARFASQAPGMIQNFSMDSVLDKHTKGLFMKGAQGVTEASVNTIAVCALNGDLSLDCIVREGRYSLIELEYKPLSEQMNDAANQLMKKMGGELAKQAEENIKKQPVIKK